MGPIVLWHRETLRKTHARPFTIIPKCEYKMCKLPEIDTAHLAWPFESHQWQNYWVTDYCSLPIRRRTFKYRQKQKAKQTETVEKNSLNYGSNNPFNSSNHWIQWTKPKRFRWIGFCWLSTTMAVYVRSRANAFTSCSKRLIVTNNIQRDIDGHNSHHLFTN